MAANPKSLLDTVTWVSAGIVSSFAAENLWIDPWIATKFNHRIPSLVPQSLSATWALTVALFGITLVFAIFCNVLVVNDRRVATSKKIWNGLVLFTVIFLGGKWLVATDARAFADQGQPQPGPKGHTVTLKWQPSATKDVRYNVYRGSQPKNHPDKLNANPLEALTFSDMNVERGKQYYYVTRAIDKKGHESRDSNEITVSVHSQ